MIDFLLTLEDWDTQLLNKREADDVIDDAIHLVNIFCIFLYFISPNMSTIYVN